MPDALFSLQRRCISSREYQCIAAVRREQVRME